MEKPVAVEVEVVPEVVAEVPVVKEVPVEVVVSRPPVSFPPVVKSDDGYREFDVYIAHTNDILGSFEDGIGMARLATGVEFGRSLTNKTLLLDAGNIASGTDFVEKLWGEPAGILLDLLGYDAVAPGPADFAYGADYLIEAARLAEDYSDLRVLSANVLNNRGEWVFQPYQLYSFDGFTVAVAGVTAPPVRTGGLSFLSDEIVEYAQFAVDTLREVADFVVVLGNIGNVDGITSEVIAANIDGIDLIIDGGAAKVPAGGKVVNNTVIVGGGEKLSSVGLVEVHVKNGKATSVAPIRINATDVDNPSKSALAQWAGIDYVPADAVVRAYLASAKSEYAALTKKPAAPVVAAPVEKPVAVEVEVVPEVVAEVPVVKEVPVEVVVSRPPVSFPPVVKSDDGYREFDVYIAHTNDILGSFEDGIGMARLATGVEFGRSLTNKTLLLDAGNIASGTDFVEKLWGEPAGILLDLLGYDAVAPGPADFAYGADYLIEIARLAEDYSDLRVLSANVLNNRGEWVFQPYQLYSFDGFTVAVAGVTAPPVRTGGLSFLSDEIVEYAQFAVDTLREVADFVVVLGNIGNVDGITSEVIAANIDGIDLIIDGGAAKVPAGGKVVNNTVIVGGGEKLSSVGLVEVHVKNGKATSVAPIRINATDVDNPSKSALAQWAGIDYVPADAVVRAYLASAKSEYAALTKKPAAPVVAAPVVEAPVVEAPVVVEVAAKVYPKDAIIKSDGDEKDFYLYVVHTNDVHGRIEAGPGVGYAKLSTLAQLGRSLTNKNLLLDAGDVSHGTLLTNIFDGETTGVLLDMVGYDAVAPGNHDFNYGKERLIEAAKLAEQYSNIKVLSANVLDENKNMVFQPYQLYYYDGFVVGVIGATTPDTETKTHPKNVQGLTFMSDEVIYGAQALVDEVRAKSDYVILLAHVGLDEDGSYGVTSKMIAENIKGIDLIVDGHSHTTLENGLRVGDTLIVQTGEYMENIGLVEISVRGGKAVGEIALLIPASEVMDPSTSDLARAVGLTEVADDPVVVAYVEQQKEILAKMTSEVVAYTAVRLDGERENVRTKPTNLGNMVAAAMVEASGADVAFTNGGGIRASIPVGDVTRGDIITVLPFNNTLVVVEVSGQDIYDALEWGYSRLPDSNGGFPQTANMSIVYSRFSEPGNRIKRVLINGKSVDPKAKYTLATNDFMAAGGDGYTMLDRPVVMYGRGLDEVLTDYMVKHNKK
ncbi:MAG: 5'-nucleotidase C-terminal domain-containing protein [Sphaerochaetaceae bacterium]